MSGVCPMCKEAWQSHWPFPAYGDPEPDCPALPPCEWEPIEELAKADVDLGGESG